MLGITPLILIILPWLFQIIFGRKAIGEDIKLKFGTICLISFLSQIILSIISFSVASYNFDKIHEGSEYKCGMGILGIIVLSFLFTIVLFITMVIQYFIKRSYEREE